MADNIEKQYPKYFFLHLFAIITLYASAANFLTLIFQYINLLIPDTTLRYFSESYSTGLIRFSISSAIIAFPLFLWSSWYLNKNYSLYPEIFKMKVRKWLIYFTLFATALIIAGDLVRTIYLLLGGEVKLRFILKALSVLIVCGVIFRYYLWELKDKFPFKRIYIAAPITLLFLIVVISGFFVIGSPNTERMRNQDQIRINDLSGIQNEIIFYWQGKQKLPAQLSELNDSISGYVVPSDPDGINYEYVVKGNNSFQLCATFKSASKQNSEIAYPMGYQDNWSHGIGRTCFDRTIDKDLYPPLIKK